jgi:hypothetical protein
VFTDAFLDTTNNNPNEFLNTGGPLSDEYGWFEMDGAVAFSSAASVQDPAFLAVRIERFENGAIAGASLPYGVGEQSNGDLVQHGPFPDNN